MVPRRTDPRGAHQAGPEGIRGLVFDLGNVLVPFDPWRAVDNLAARSGRSRWLIAGYFYLTQRWTQFDRGRYGREAFCRRVIRDLRLPLTVDQFAAAFEDIFGPPHRRLAAALEGLGRRFPLFLLSDNNPIHTPYCLARYPFLDRFQVRLFSYQVGCKKPAPRIYRTLVARTGLRAAALLFVDDKPANVAGARRAGMQAVLFRGEEAFLAQLAEWGWLPGETPLPRGEASGTA